jgi:hypothetical protein
LEGRRQAGERPLMPIYLPLDRSQCPIYIQLFPVITPHIFCRAQSIILFKICHYQEGSNTASNEIPNVITGFSSKPELIFTHSIA